MITGWMVLVIVVLLVYQSVLLMRTLRRLLTLESALEAMWTRMVASGLLPQSTKTSSEVHPRPGENDLNRVSDGRA
jgi:hypothetical protein